MNQTHDFLMDPRELPSSSSSHSVNRAAALLEPNMQDIRRFLVIVSLMLWQGGFMFYGGVVVPVGSHVLGSDSAQGFITQSVTNYLNLVGLLCLVMSATNLWIERAKASKLEWKLLGVASLLLVILVIVHRQLDGFLDARTNSVVNPGLFGWVHEVYIGCSTIQWLACLVLLFVTLRRWTGIEAVQSEL